MSNDFGPNDGTTGPDPGAVPSEWAAPTPSSLPPPPSLAPPASPLAPPAAVSTGPVMADVPRKPRWVGRGVALVAAASLVGGGGYLAISAGTADGGADSAAEALDGALAALSAEDLIGAAEFIEPTERETMIDAGFDVIDELIRLDVFGESLDLSAVEGIDLEFDNIEIESTEIRDGLAHLYLVGGEVTAAIDGQAVPFGPLITERVGEDDLAIEESSTEPVTRGDFPVVAVERDGRWYLSLWYSVAENARLELGQPLPARSDRLVEIGADTPERTIENFVGALEHLDVATMIGLLDPQEASALYDYGSLFVGDAQDGADEFLRQMRHEGWAWEVTELDVRAETDGTLATVYIDRFDFEAGSADSSLTASFTADRVEVDFESPEVVFHYLVEGDCFTMTFDEGYGADTQSMCTDELLDDVGLGSLSSGAMGGLTTIDEFGIVVRNVGGRWFISPLRTGSEMMLATLRAVDAEMVAETVDALVEMFNDPYAFQSAFEGVLGEDASERFAEVESYPANTTTTSGSTEDFPTLTEDNAHLLADGPEFVFVYDLADVYREDLWRQWLTDVPAAEFGDGVVGQAFLPGDYYVDVVVLAGIPFESDEAVADWLGARLVTVDEAFAYAVFTNSWGDELLIARSIDDQLAIVTMYDGFSEEAVTALRNQVGR